MPTSFLPVWSDRRALGCPIGLLLVVLEVRAFGVDFANDIAGYLLVAYSAVRAAVASGRWTLVAGAAMLAAVVALFGYGGPISHLVVFGDVTWSVVVAAERLVGAFVFVLVLWALAGMRAGTSPARPLLVAALVLAGSALAWVAIVVFTDALAGPLGILAALLSVVVGLLKGFAVLAAFVFSRIS